MTNSNKSRNTSQSIKDRLKYIARQEKKNVNLVYLTYVFERFLFKLSVSPYKDNLVLKGGLLLYCEGKTSRQTRDIDFLCQNFTNDEMKIKEMIMEICALPSPDPIEFKIRQITLTKQMILSQNHGFKVTIPFEFNSAPDKMQIDLGFGEIISPKARKILFPTILPEYQPFSILAYTTETLMAEKLNALYVLGVRNTRMKDYYDLFVLLEISEFTQKLLLEAIKSTFTQRKTQIDSRLLLNLLNSPDLSSQFERYCKKISIPNIPFLQISQRLIKSFQPIFILIEENTVPADDIKWDNKKFQWN